MKWAVLMTVQDVYDGPFRFHSLSLKPYRKERLPPKRWWRHHVDIYILLYYFPFPLLTCQKNSSGLMLNVEG